MSHRFVATRSVLLNGRMYQKGERIECVLTRGRAKLLMATQAIEERAPVDEPPAPPTDEVVSVERNSMRPTRKPKRVKA